MASAGFALVALDHAVLAIFVAELAIRIGAYGWGFFRDPWSIFDFVVVALALAPSTENFSVLRALRVLRVLRLITAVPQMRRVVGGLLSALPGLGSVVAILALIFYVAAVMATQIFGEDFPAVVRHAVEEPLLAVPDHDPGELVDGHRPAGDGDPSLCLGVLRPFILIATFTMLNLFIAVVVNAMQSYHDREAEHAEKSHTEHAELLAEIGPCARTCRR